MGQRKYYHHVEKSPENVRSIWKVLHSTIFLLIILNALMSSYIFGDILKSFNFRCILHGEPTFALIHTVYINNTNQHVDSDRSKKDILSIPLADNNENTTTKFLLTDKEETPSNNITLEPLFINETREPIILMAETNSSANGSELQIDWKTVSKFSRYINNIYVYNDSFWFKNETVYGQIDVRIRGSDYGSTTSCDLVLFVPLISLIAAAAFGALIMLFGRGQDSQRAWVVVYPVLIASAILSIMSVIAFVSMKNGVEDFCAQFFEYTGNQRCSSDMGYFTFQGIWSLSDFWGSYLVCYYSFLFALILWIFQTVVTIFRLTSLADFHFGTVIVQKENAEDIEELDEKIHDVLVKSGMRPMHDKNQNKNKSFKSDQNEDSITVI